MPTARRQVGRDGVVLDLRTSVYFGLSHSASALWPGLLAGSTFQELVNVLLTDAPDLRPERPVIEVSCLLHAIDDEHLLDPVVSGA